MAVLAGKQPAGVICEIAGDDGEMLRGQDLKEFSRAHGFVQISIEELVEYLAKPCAVSIGSPSFRQAVVTPREADPGPA